MRVRGSVLTHLPRSLSRWLVLLVALASIGCQARGSADPEAAEATPGGEPEPTMAVEDAPDETGSSSSEAAVDPALEASPAERPVIGRTVGNREGLELEVHELARRADGMTTIKLTLINGSEQDLGGYDLGSPAHSVPDFASIGGVHLLDTGAMTKYDVDRGPDGRCLCSRRLAIEPGARAYAWAKFSTLPAEAASVTVVVPGFEPIESVPVSTVAEVAPANRAEGQRAGTWVELGELARNADGSLTVRLRFLNQSQESVGGYDLTDPDHEVADFNTVGGVKLLDARSMTLTDVDRDQAGKCVCATGVSIEPGSQGRAWARFSGIPAEVTRVTVVVPTFEPFEEVPIASS